MVAAGRCRDFGDDRRRRHVVLRGRTAGNTGGSGGGSRGRIASLHDGNDGLRRRRRGHRATCGPLWRRDTTRPRYVGTRVRLSGRRACRESGPAGACPFADRIRLLGHLWAVDGRHIPVVRSPPRHRCCDRRRRKLSRRHDLAAGSRTFHRRRWLAGDTRRYWSVRARHHAADRSHAAPADLGASRQSLRRDGAAAVAGIARSAASAPLCCRHRLLRCHGDAAAASRRLLRRTGLWPRARRARGAEMLSLMLGCGIVSRVGSGFIADRIGGLRTLLLGSVLQGTALFLYLWFDDLVSLYVISALFGLFQGGIVPSYTIIVREFFPAREAGTRVGLVLLATVVGMALGGWMSGAIFDATGSYRAAFLNGLAWNLMNLSIVLSLLLRARRRTALA